MTGDGETTTAVEMALGRAMGDRGGSLYGQSAGFLGETEPGTGWWQQPQPGPGMGWHTGGALASSPVDTARAGNGAFPIRGLAILPILVMGRRGHHDFFGPDTSGFSIGLVWLTGWVVS